MESSGWLLDITEDREGTGVVLWLKSQRSGRVVARREPFRPAFWVTGPRDGLARLEKELTARPDVDQVERRTARPSLFDRRPRTVLSVRPRRNFARRRLAGEVDALGNYHEFTLYDVDLSAPQLYHLTHGLYPFAPVTWTAEAVTATEPAETIDYDPPPLRGAELTVELVGHRRGRIRRPTAGSRRSSWDRRGSRAGRPRCWPSSRASSPGRTPISSPRTAGMPSISRGSTDGPSRPVSRRRSSSWGASRSLPIGPPGPFVRDLRPDPPRGRHLPPRRALPRRPVELLPLRRRLDRRSHRGSTALAALAADGRPAVARHLLHRDGDGARARRGRPHPVEEEPSRGVQVGPPAGRGRPRRGPLPPAGRGPRPRGRVRLREPVPAHHGAAEPLDGDAQLPMLPPEPQGRPRARLPLVRAAGRAHPAHAHPAPDPLVWPTSVGSRPAGSRSPRPSASRTGRRC